MYAGFSLPGCYFFFTPWYSSTVFVVMVVVTWDVSLACIYVAVVLIVRHALQLVMPTATQTIAINTNKCLFIVVLLFA